MIQNTDLNKLPANPCPLFLPLSVFFQATIFFPKGHEGEENANPRGIES